MTEASEEPSGTAWQQDWARVRKKACVSQLTGKKKSKTNYKQNPIKTNQTTKQTQLDTITFKERLSGIQPELVHFQFSIVARLSLNRKSPCFFESPGASGKGLLFSLLPSVFCAFCAWRSVPACNFGSEFQRCLSTIAWSLGGTVWGPCHGESCSPPAGQGAKEGQEGPEVPRDTRRPHSFLLPDSIPQQHCRLGTKPSICGHWWGIQDPVQSKRTKPWG